MSVDPRVARTTEHMLHALDSHLYTLRTHLSKLQESSSHLKVISAELRVLVCKSAKLEGLIWRLVDTLDVDDGVYLNVAGKFDTTHALAKDLSFMIAPITRGHHAHPHFTAQIYSLKEVLKQSDALIADGKPLTHEKLIRNVAEQMGLAHEADKLDPALIHASSIFINGVEPIMSVLAQDAALVLEVGERVLVEAERSLKFSRSNHTYDYGNLTIFATVDVHKLPSEKMLVFKLQSFVSSVSIDFYLTTNGSEIEVKKRKDVLFKDESSVVIPQDGDWSFAEALSFCSSTQQIRTFDENQNGVAMKKVAKCALGWVYATDFEMMITPANEFFEMKSFFAFSRLLSSREVYQIATEPNSGGIFISEEELAKRGVFPD